MTIRKLDYQHPGLPSIRRRLSSLLYEGVLLFGVLSVTFFVPHLVLAITTSILLPGWAVLLHLIVTAGVYFVVYWHFVGQTLPMQTWQLVIVSQDGSKPSIPRLIVRYLLAWPSIACFGAGLLWAPFDRDRQFLHDRLAKTGIVFKPKPMP